MPEFVVIPDGHTETIDRREFNLDAESAAGIISTFTKRAMDVVIDYEHQTQGGDFAAPDGKAPAAGWIKALRYEPGKGIVATVEWTGKALDLIRKKEYRYMSPVMAVDKETKFVTELRSVALTNYAAIPNQTAIAAKADDGFYLIAAKAVEVASYKASADAPRGETTMDLKALRAALAAAGLTLAETDDDAAVLTMTAEYVKKTAELLKAAPKPLEAVAAKLGLAADATVELVTAKVTELQTGKVDACEYNALKSRLETIEVAAKARESQELVALGIETAKLNPNNENQMVWARATAKSDPIGFKAFLDAAPTLYTPGTVVKPNPALDKATERTAIICAAAKEYDENSGRLHGVEKSQFVNVALREKDLVVLSADEIKNMKGGH